MSGVNSKTVIGNSNRRLLIFRMYFSYANKKEPNHQPQSVGSRPSPYAGRFVGSFYTILSYWINEVYNFMVRLR